MNHPQHAAATVEAGHHRGRAPAPGRRFVCESEAYALIEKSGLRPPRHTRPGTLSLFNEGERVVVKGMGEDLWHKSELDAVRFMAFEDKEVLREAAGMRARITKAEHRWLGALVCEEIEIARSGGLPTELLVSLARTEAGWVIVFGAGGLGAELLGSQVRPLLWPVDAVSPVLAQKELEAHFLGSVLLGKGRGAGGVTTHVKLATMLEALWRLAALAEAEGLSLLEMNPVAFDSHGEARPLDAVGMRGERAAPRHEPPEDFIHCLLAPRRVAIAGVSAIPGGVGRTVLDNVSRCAALKDRITVLKPGAENLLGHPCIHSVAALMHNPVDLLLLATPARASVGIIEELIAQGGGAHVVGVIAGGIGDGADHSGLGPRLAACLADARARNRWTPAVVGPNSMGHWVPGRGLDTTFIPREKLPEARDAAGSLVLLSQSGAFLLCRRSKHPGLGLLFGAALGNQMDAALPDFLRALVPVAECNAVAAYIEGFKPGQLAATVQAARRLGARGVKMLLHRAGRTAAGQAAAASHTGALLAGRSDRANIERALLERAGVRFSETVADFDAALQWLAAFPQIRPGPVALVSNAGFECVTGSDAITGASKEPTGFFAAAAHPATTARLERMLADENLAGIVNAQLPLDLTPMAGESAFLKASEILLHGAAGVLILGLVPFTPRVNTGGDAAMFAASLASLARTTGKPVGIVIDAGEVFAEFRGLFLAQRLPVFERFEDAIRGLRTLG